MDMEMEQQPQPGENQNNNGVREILTMARQLIDEGKPSLALQAVVMAMKTEGGDNAVVETLNRARELYRNKLRSNAAADELASLFAECAIVEAHPPDPSQQPSPFDTGGGGSGSSSMMTMAVETTPDADGSSILAKTGRKQVMLDAFADGSSFVCLQCGGLVSNHRKDEHLAYWCCQL